MKMSGYKRFLKTDFPSESQALIEKLSYSVNNGIEAVYGALNKNITLKDNILCTVKDISIEVDALGTPKANSTFTTGLTVQIIGLQILKVDNNTNSLGYPTTAPWISWTQVNNGIRIDHISGLVANNSHTIRLVVYG
jgi:hypothetical protein